MNTRKLLIIIIIAIFTSSSIQAQSLVDELLEDGFQIKQRPESESRLKNLFSGLAVTDTVYCYIVPIGHCPRCESAISNLHDFIKSEDTDKNTILISVYPDSLASKKYLESSPIKSDYIIYDSNNIINDIFSFSIGKLHVPYLTKIDTKNGEMIVGVSPDDISSEFIKDFCSYNNKISNGIYTLGETNDRMHFPSDEVLTAKRSIPVSLPDSIRLSSIIYQPEYKNGHLLLNDKLEGILHFTQSPESHDLIFTDYIKTSPSQNKTFIEVEDAKYDSMLKRNEFRFMPLSSKIQENGTIATTYSLPWVWMEDPSTLVYMNAMCVLISDIDSLSSSSVLPLNGNLDDNFYEHFYLFNYGDNIAIPSQPLTWPLILDKSFYEDNPEINPFDHQFYKSPRSLFSIFDRKSGNIIKEVGTLPTLAEKTLTGYYFMSPVLDSHNKTIAYSDGISGQIVIMDLDTDSIKGKYNIFEVSNNELPSPDSSKFHSYDCIEPYLEILDRNIFDIQIHENMVYCLIRYGKYANVSDDDLYSVVRLDWTTGDVNEKSFPKLNYEAFGLTKDKSGISPYALSKLDFDWQIILFDF